MKKTFFLICVVFVGLLLHSCDSKPVPSYRPVSNTAYKGKKLDYDTTGWIRKYFDASWKPVYYASEGFFYREAYYINGRIVADSLVRDYFKNGELQFEGHIRSESPDVLIGKGTWFFLDGSVLKTCNYDSYGRAQGSSIEYYQNGQKKSVVKYVDDIPVGDYVVYHNNGKKKQVGSYRDGKQHGKQYEYFENGKIYCVINLKNGILEGNAVEYYENGRVKQKGQYRNGMPVGIWTNYDEQGRASYIDRDQIVTYSQPRRRSFSPDDAYDEGYDNGYEQGRRDGKSGHGHGYRYDESSDYYNHYETRYTEGYEEGYDEGFSQGEDEYEDGEDD